MQRRLRSGAITALALLVTATAARADRVPSARVPGPPPATNGRPDITVPYTTNGNSTLGVWNFVGPRIYASPIVNDPANPGARPVYNLPFYGGVQAFGDRSNGAVPREYVPVPLPQR